MASACFPLTKYRWCALRCAWAKTGESGEEVGGADGARGGKIFSKTTRKLPVQLNRKQYENLFESFDYTKEATVDVGRRARREREGEREEKRTHSREEKDILSGARKQWATIRLAKRITVFTFKLNYFLRFVYHIYIYVYTYTYNALQPVATFNRRSSSSIFICRVPKILPSFIHAIEIPFHCRWNNIEREREEIHFKKENKNIYLTDDKSNLYARYDNFCCFLWRKRGEEKNNGHRSISRRKIRIENVEREREMYR